MSASYPGYAIPTLSCSAGNGGAAVITGFGALDGGDGIVASGSGASVGSAAVVTGFGARNPS